MSPGLVNAKSRQDRIPQQIRNASIGMSNSGKDLVATCIQHNHPVDAIVVHHVDLTTQLAIMHHA